MQIESVPLVVEVVVWTCVLTFVATSVITLLALLGMITIGGGDESRHDYFLRKLFNLLIVEIILVSIAVYGAYFNHANDEVKALVEQSRGVSHE